MLKKIIFLLTAFCITLSACSKKDSTTPSTTSGTTSGTTNSSSLTVNGTAETLTVTQINYVTYNVTGTPTTGNYYVNATYINGKPTSSSTVTLNSSTQQPSLSVSDKNGNNWVPSGGTGTITVSGSSVTLSFSNLTFNALIGNSAGATGNLTVSATMTSN